MMDFDAVNFPYVIMSGRKTLNILNVEEASMQPLLKIPTDARSGSSIAFLLREDNGFALHITRIHVDDEKNVHHEWVRLLLRDDFITCLKELGRLPPVTTRGIIEECKKANLYDELSQNDATTLEGSIIQKRLNALKAEREKEAKVSELILKENKETIARQTQLLEQKEKTILQKDKLNEEQKATIDDMQRRIAELE